MMLKSMKKTIGAACASVSLFALAQAGPYDDPAPEQDAPAMWTLTDEDSTIYLFGTFHLLPQDVEWQSDAFREAMADTPLTMFEADATSPEALAQLGQLVQQYGLNPPGTTLSDILGPDRMEALGEVAQRYGVPVQALEPLRPWLALLSITQAAYASAGLDASAGVESVVLTRATGEGDEIDYLETPEIQIVALSRLDGEEMLNNFDVGLEQFDTLEEDLARTIDVWARGDLAAFEDLVIDDMRGQAPQAFDVIFTERNADWTAQIVEMMAGDGDVFIAVGAGHLVGEDSVIDMLVEQGFAPSRVQ